MTLPNWGRITPAQGFMLMLAGFVPHRNRVEPGTVEPDEARLASMRQGRERLRALTGHDCGYDLARWHALLTSDPAKWGYQHVYAGRRVRRAIEMALDDPDRLRLVGLLEAD